MLYPVPWQRFDIHRARQRIDPRFYNRELLRVRGGIRASIALLRGNFVIAPVASDLTNLLSDLPQLPRGGVLVNYCGPLPTPHIRPIYFLARRNHSTSRREEKERHATIS